MRYLACIDQSEAEFTQPSRIVITEAGTRTLINDVFIKVLFKGAVLFKLSNNIFPSFEARIMLQSY